MIRLLLSNNKLVIFSKTEKNSCHSKHEKNHAVMMSLWKRNIQIGVLKNRES